MNEREEALELINASAPQGADIGKSWEWLGTKAFVFNNMELAAVAFETALRFGMLEPASWGRLAAVYKFEGLFAKGGRVPDARAGSHGPMILSLHD